MARHFLIGLAILALAGCASQPPPTPPPTQTPQTTVSPTAKSISLNTFETPSPLPSQSVPLPSNADGSCPHDNGVNIGREADPNCTCYAYYLTCRQHECVDIRAGDIPPGSGYGFYWPPLTCETGGNGWCQTSLLTGDGDGLYCVGKPVIYLYPTVATFVDVLVKTSGQIVVSDPHYPQEGWQDVLAHPNGRLVYQGKSYHELFYESEVTSVARPLSGLTIAREDLIPELTRVTYQLGLTGYEQLEFIDFWVPKLQALNSPYVFFSVVDSQVKESIDAVTISPKPDTFIAFIAYFAPLDKPFDGPALTMPPRPERIGFTAVEWGGTIGPALHRESQRSFQLF